MMDICVYILYKKQNYGYGSIFFRVCCFASICIGWPEIIQHRVRPDFGRVENGKYLYFFRYIISIALHADTTVAQCVCLWHITRAANVRVEYAHLPSARPFSQLLINYSCLPQQWSRALSRCVCICKYKCVTTTDTLRKLLFWCRIDRCLELNRTSTTHIKRVTNNLGNIFIPNLGRFSRRICVERRTEKATWGLRKSSYIAVSLQFRLEMLETSDK